MSDINIVFTRVDNRLVHGQVGNVWVTASGANLILVVDDETCNDELSKSLMKMTADAVGVQIRFFSIIMTLILQMLLLLKLVLLCLPSSF